jgi:Holliday junction resolvasome RuvABC endonuclease subunit
VRYIGGIDPGLTGALAVLDLEDYRLHLWDTPVVLVKTGTTTRKKPNPEAFTDAFRHFPLDYCTIENVHSTPNDGHVGAFTFGKVTGIAIGIAHGLDIPLAQVSPAKWKMQMLVPAHKDASKNRASALFPYCAPMWARAMDHGRAEAAVIALYSAILCGLAPAKPFQIGLLNGEEFVPGRAKKKAA